MRCYFTWGAHDEHECCIPFPEHANYPNDHECECGAEHRHWHHIEPRVPSFRENA